MKAACIHELDVVRLCVPVTGRTPAGGPMHVPAGTEGAVILEHPGSDVVEVEVTDPESGRPQVFFAAPRGSLEAVWRAATRSAA